MPPANVRSRGTKTVARDTGLYYIVLRHTASGQYLGMDGKLYPSWGRCVKFTPNDGMRNGFDEIDTYRKFMETKFGLNPDDYEPARIICTVERYFAVCSDYYTRLWARVGKPLETPDRRKDDGKPTPQD